MPKEHPIEEIKAEGLEVDFAALASGGFAAVAEDDFYRLKTKGVCSVRKGVVNLLGINEPERAEWRESAQMALTQLHTPARVTSSQAVCAWVRNCL